MKSTRTVRPRSIVAVALVDVVGLIWLGEQRVVRFPEFA